jgi:Transglutaminase-like superfamily
MMHDPGKCTSAEPTFRGYAATHCDSTGTVGRSPTPIPAAPESRLLIAQKHEVVAHLFWTALVGLLAFDVLGFSRNFFRMHRFVSNCRVSTKKASDETVDLVCRAVNCACNWYPKRVLCLQRSAVTTCLLRRCGIPASMVMGAQILPFKAHAWTEVDGRPINERREVQKVYTTWERC